MLSILQNIQTLLPDQARPVIHRDFSWVQFNERVLEEALASTNPLLERVKFLAITSSNMDEFFMIRVASLARSIQTLKRRLELVEARRLDKVLDAILEAAQAFNTRQSSTLDSIAKGLSVHGVHIIREFRPREREFPIVRALFETQILPKLPPPESFTPDKVAQLDNLESAVILPGDLWIRIPRNLPTMVFAPGPGKKEICFSFSDELMMAFLSTLYQSKKDCAVVRLTRDGDFTLAVEETDPEVIPDVLRTRIGTREKGKPIRLQILGTIAPLTLKKFESSLKLERSQIFQSKTSVFLNGLWTLFHNCPDNLSEKEPVKYPPLQTKVPSPFDSKDNLFEKIKTRDYLLHHPYDSFDAFVQLMRAAAEDPLVTQIDQTIYRMDAMSPVLDILKSAAKKKKVRVFIELRARFDELNNLKLADDLRKAGVVVVYGFGPLKLHAKVALFTRKEPGGETLYTHLSTGNYNAATARQYTDLAIVTSHPEIGEDAKHFFNSLSQGEIPSSFKQLVIAPSKLARRVRSLIQAEAEAARQGKKTRIVAKVNALVDDGTIQSLYDASRAGVQVDLIVRGACSLVPGIPGLSENIRVVSIVDRYLEHSRIYYFEHSKKMYFSSADWMPRNFFSRLEIAFPVLNEKIFDYMKDVVLPAYLADTVKAKELTSQGVWKKRSQRTQSIRSQVFFRELALRDYRGTPLE